MKKVIVLFLIINLFFCFDVFAQDTTDRAFFSDIPPFAPQAGEFHYTPRPLTEIVIHHSGSFPYDNSPEANASAVASYRNYHKNTVHPGIYSDKSTWAWYFDSYLSQWVQMPAQEGFPDGVSGPNGYNYDDLDYHYLVGTDGLVYTGRRIDTVGWHASNWTVNLRSIGVCFVGNFDATVPNASQYWTGVDLVSKLMLQYEITDISRHSDYAAKSCPGYSFPFYQFVSDSRRWAGIYTDVDFSFWAHNSIATLGQKNILYGYSDGSFKPNNYITRGEFVYLLWKLNNSPSVSDYTFVDVSNHWAKDAITWAVSKNYVQGYANGMFMPDKYISRAEMAKIMFNYEQPLPVLESFFSDVPDNHWAKIFISSCYMANIISGYPDGTFRPDSNATRAEAVTLIERAK